MFLHQCVLLLPCGTPLRLALVFSSAPKCGINFDLCGRKGRKATYFEWQQHHHHSRLTSSTFAQRLQWTTQATWHAAFPFDGSSLVHGTGGGTGATWQCGRRTATLACHLRRHEKGRRGHGASVHGCVAEKPRRPDGPECTPIENRVQRAVHPLFEQKYAAAA